MKAVIFIRNKEKDSNSQILRLRKYCATNNIEVAQEVTGRIYLTKINFSEETVILGVDLDFKQDIQYIDENSLEFLFPSQKVQKNVLFCGLSWQYQLFSEGYPQQHRYSSHWFINIFSNALVQRSDAIRKKFDSIINSDAADAFDNGVTLAKKVNTSWSMELLYGFNLLEKLVQKKLNSTNKGVKLYENLCKNSSFISYLDGIEKSDLDKWNECTIALHHLSQGMGENYRNIMTHELFLECTDSSNWKEKNNLTRFISENSLGCLEKLKNLYLFIQNWKP